MATNGLSGVTIADHVTSHFLPGNMLNLPRLKDLAIGLFTRRLTPSPHQTQQKERLEQLAQEVVEYGRMVSTGSVIIWLPDVAYRLRETPRDLQEALYLLSTKGIAVRTNLKDYWKIRCLGRRSLSDVARSFRRLLP